MSTPIVSLQAQIAEIDRLLTDERKHSGVRNDALRAVAADLRARLAGAPSTTAAALEQRIDYAKRSRSDRGGYADGPLIALANELIGHWPVVKIALERFETEVSA